LAAEASTGRPHEHSWRMILNSISTFCKVVVHGNCYRETFHLEKPFIIIFAYGNKSACGNDSIVCYVKRYGRSLLKSVKAAPVFWIVSLSRLPKAAQNAVLMLA